MFMAKSEYDRGVNTFSPEGRLFQVEYAIQAVKLGSTSIGIKTADGVVLAVEKRVTSTLMESSSIEKVMEIDSHSRRAGDNHRFTYDEPMPTTALTQSVCDLALSFGEDSEEREGGASKMSRPFGVALLVAGYDDDGAQLYYADPSGTFTQSDEKKIGTVKGAPAPVQA
ncbi:threonine-type endopeptidase [Aureococcus anophagefferens]|uniref:Proteasome subunit alpha type n=1 Tax=Aureococcus anophagefferens TaxID=44056 RepID=A0ABR1G6Z7_AURAN